MPKYVIDFLTNKFTTVFSNSNVSRVPMVFDGKSQLGLFYFVPVMGKLNSGICVITAGDHMSLACMSDTSAIRNAKEFIQIFEQKNAEALKAEGVEEA